MNSALPLRLAGRSIASSQGGEESPDNTGYRTT
jgi:hypothetical protein